MIQTDYQNWIQNPVRAQSPSYDFGCWWVLYPDDPPITPIRAIIAGHPVAILNATTYKRWRVSWIDDTGELYAVQLGSDLFIALGHFETKPQVEKRMEGWAEGPHALVDFFPQLFICERYKAELVRLYGQECADSSIVQLEDDGTYLISVPPLGKPADPPARYPLAMMQAMLANLQKRKPQTLHI